VLMGRAGEVSTINHARRPRKRPAWPQQPNLYLEPKRLRWPEGQGSEMHLLLAVWKITALHVHAASRRSGYGARARSIGHQWCKMTNCRRPFSQKACVTATGQFIHWANMATVPGVSRQGSKFAFWRWIKSQLYMHAHGANRRSVEVAGRAGEVLVIRETRWHIAAGRFWKRRAWPQQPNVYLEPTWLWWPVGPGKEVHLLVAPWQNPSITYAWAKTRSVEVTKGAGEGWPSGM
jgi:GNAT superfamily N-acetyltransferase